MCSCATVGTLQADLCLSKHSLAYLHDTEPYKWDKKNTVHVAEVKDVSPASFSEVTNVSTSVTPLLIFNEWKQEFSYQFGKNQIQSGLPSFVRTSFVDESNRSASFSADTICNNPEELLLNIRIENVKGIGPYRVRGSSYTWCSFGFMRNRNLQDPPQLLWLFLIH
jgi:hypothetical protein